MICYCCGEEKLSREFPHEHLTEECTEHPLLHCLRVSIDTCIHVMLGFILLKCFEMKGYGALYIEKFLPLSGKIKLLKKIK